MRFCPFCAQENRDENRECASCGKRLPRVRRAQVDATTQGVGDAAPAPELKPEPKPEPKLEPALKPEPAPAPVRAVPEPSPRAATGTLLGIPTAEVTRAEVTRADEPLPVEAGVSMPPMPAHPASASLWSAVLYLWPVARARWARGRAAARVRALLETDQRDLDGVLKELGHVARAERIDAPGAFDDLKRVEEEEQRQRDADDLMKRVVEDRIKEEARRDAERREHEEDLAERARQVAAVETRLAARQAEKRELLAKKSRLEAHAKTADVGAELSAVSAKIAALEEPTAKLTEELTLGRAELEGRKKIAREATERHKKLMVELDAQEDKAKQERERAEREMSRRFVSIGTMLNLNRVDHAKLNPIYEKIDALKKLIGEKESTIERLDKERHAFDRPALQKGLVLVGGTLATVLLLVVIAIVVAAR